MFVVKSKDAPRGIRGIDLRHSGPPGEGGWDLRGIVVRNLKTNEERVFVPDGDGPGGMAMGENDSRELTYKPGQHVSLFCGRIFVHSFDHQRLLFSLSDLQPFLG